MIKAFAPASVSNVAVGFDILGFALQIPGDEVIISKGQQSGVTISKITKGKDLPTDPTRNTAGVAAQRLLDYLGISDKAIQLEIRKKMPYGTGLGSSAASAVAAVVGLNKYLKAGLSKRELLPFAMQGEEIAAQSWVADNVISSMMGGIILIRDSSTLDFTKLYVPQGLRYVVILPNTTVLTSESRTSLSDHVLLSDHITQTGNAATLVAALYSSDFDKISRCLTDVVIEPQRAHYIPSFYEMKDAALDAGALGFSISGSGPGMFALCDSTYVCDEVELRASRMYPDAMIYQGAINQEGAIIC